MVQDRPFARASRLEPQTPQQAESPDLDRIVTAPARGPHRATPQKARHHGVVTVGDPLFERCPTRRELVGPTNCQPPWGEGRPWRRCTRWCRGRLPNRPQTRAAAQSRRSMSSATEHPASAERVHWRWTGPSSAIHGRRHKPGDPPPRGTPAPGAGSSVASATPSRCGGFACAAGHGAGCCASSHPASGPAALAPCQTTRDHRRVQPMARRPGSERKAQK